MQLQLYMYSYQPPPNYSCTTAPAPTSTTHQHQHHSALAVYTVQLYRLQRSTSTTSSTTMVRLPTTYQTEISGGTDGPTLALCHAMLHGPDTVSAARRSALHSCISNQLSTGAGAGTVLSN